MKNTGNRRRVDVAKKTGEAKALVSSVLPRVLKTLAVCLLSVALVVGGKKTYEWMNTSERFALKHISCIGNEAAKESDLLRLANLNLGQNLFAMDTKSIEAALLTHPWVKKVELTRKFPNRLELKIDEHRPLALVSMGDLYLVSDEGVPFKRVKVGDSVDYPVVTGIDRETFVSSSDEAKRALQNAISKLTIYTASEAGRTDALSEIHVETDSLSVVTVTGQVVQFGDGNFEEKLKKLIRVRNELESRQQVAQVIRLDNRVRPHWISVQLGEAEKPRQ
jgi:cell division protein FtsQ